MNTRDFRPRDTDIYRPYPDEIPWDLLAMADPDEDRVTGYADAEYMRVAKYHNEPVGVYVVKALSATCFELCNLAVDPVFRRKGLGRWLLGHAIGLSETKGGREILVRRTQLKGLFRRTGFVAEGEDLRLTLTPE